jgi:hypothetical protein
MRQKLHFYSSSFKFLHFIHAFIVFAAASVYDPLVFFLSKFVGESGKPVSLLAVYALFVLFYEWVGWRALALYPRMGVVLLEGTWNGIITHKDETRFDVIINIRQYSSRMIIEFMSGNAKSYSFASSIRFDEKRNKIDFCYNYSTNGFDNRKSQASHHVGTVLLKSELKDQFTGIYFTENKVDTQGYIEIQRIKDPYFSLKWLFSILYWLLLFAWIGLSYYYG